MSQNNNDTPNTMAEKTTTDIFTAREQEIMLNALLCMKEAPAVDFTELAARLGMSNIRSASNAWAALRKKIQERNPNPDGGPVLVTKRNTPAKTPKATPSKRKKTAVPSTPTPSNNGDDIAIKTEHVATPSSDDDDVLELGPAAKRPKKAKRVVPGLANPQGEVGEMVLPLLDGGETRTPLPADKGKAPAKTPTKPRAPRVKKEKAVAADGEEGEEVSETLKKIPAAKATPKKKTGKVVKSDAMVKEEDLEDESGEDRMVATAAAALKIAEAAAGEDAMEKTGENVKVEGGDGMEV